MKNRKLLIGLVVLAAVLVYANSLFNLFAYDDIWIIQKNDRVHQLRDLSKILMTPYWPSYGSELGLYRPFTILAFAIEWAVSGGAAWFFHLMNVVLHASACVLAFLLIEKLTNTRAAFAGALAFALHPLHTEAVANLVGQGELWAAIAVFAACIIYVDRPDGPYISTNRTIAVLALYAVALMFKESAVVLPGLLVLLDFAQKRVSYARAEFKGYVNAVGFMIAMCCVILFGFLVLRLHVLGNVTGTDAAPGLPYLREQYRVLNAFRAWPEFVRLLFVPLDLSVDYAPGLILPVESLQPMVILGMMLVATAVTLTALTPYRPIAGIAAGWFLIAILPVSNFFFPIGVLIAERTLYLGSFGVCLLAGYAVDRAMLAPARETRRLTIAAAAIVALFFSIRTVKRNPDWKDLGTVWNGLSRDHPESYRAQWLNAIDMWSKGKNELAEKYFQLAERIWSRDSQFLTEFANFYIGQRRYDKAIEYLERSRDMTPFVPRTWEYLAYAYLHDNKPQPALAAAMHANSMEGAHPSLNYTVIAGAYEQLGRYDEATGAWRSAVRINRDALWLDYAMQARSLARAGRKNDALAAVDVANKKTLNEPSLQNVIKRLRSAIESDCYAHDSSACDPLQGWVVASPSPVTER